MSQILLLPGHMYHAAAEIVLKVQKVSRSDQDKAYGSLTRRSRSSRLIRRITKVSIKLNELHGVYEGGHSAYPMNADVHVLCKKYTKFML